MAAPWDDLAIACTRTAIRGLAFRNSRFAGTLLVAISCFVRSPGCIHATMKRFIGADADAETRLCEQ
jgi:hypothetical protein